jgi:phosphoglycolate phosphatase
VTGQDRGERQHHPDVNKKPEAEKKPDPAGLNALVVESGADRARTIMVGDSSVDVETARNAGVQACGVRWGFQPETFVSSPPDFLIDDLRELIGR